MFKVSSFVRGLLITGASSLAVASVSGCVEGKGDLAKGEVDQSSPPGSPTPLVDGKSDGGTTFAVALESAHPYANNLDRTYSVDLDAIVPSCTARVRAHFAALRTESSYDFVHVLAPDGSVVESLTGDRDGVWSAWVDVTPGDLRLDLALETDYSITSYGFRVDAVEVETAVACPAVVPRVCDPGYFDVTPAPAACECRGETMCAEDAWVEIEHAIGGGFSGEVQGRRLVGQSAQNVSYKPGEPDVEANIGSLDRAAVQELVHAVVDSGILDRAEVDEVSNWNETLRIRIGTRAVAFTRPQGTYPADEQALIARFEELFTCGGGGTALTCGADFTCSAGACVEAEGCVCPAVYLPVCGADGRTYSNACAAGCANAAVEHDGECGIAGDFCGGLGAFACQDGFKCRYDASTFEAPHPDAAGACVAETYCDAVADCAGLPHIAVPGTWACQAQSCAWQTGPAWQAVTGYAFVSAHPYANNQTLWSQLYLPDGATRMRLVVSPPFELEQGYDKLEVWTWRGTSWVKVRTYTGNAGPAATDEFDGQYHYLKFVSDSSVTRYGFDLVAQYAM